MPAQPDDFQFVILKPNWHGLKLGYKAPEALRRLQDVDADGQLLAMSLDAIDHYDWRTQTIALTEDGTSVLARTLASQEPEQEADPRRSSQACL